jgi:hypothetical protein
VCLLYVYHLLLLRLTRNSHTLVGFSLVSPF